MEKLDIVEQVSGPTKFQSLIVVVPKTNDDIRVCVDMRLANESIEQKRFSIPTVDEILADMNGAKVFSNLDLNMEFNLIDLEEKSRDVTTFTTHIGLYRYKRLMFGVTSAPEIYQHVIQQALQGCKGAGNMTDDIIIFAETVEENDTFLEAVLLRLKERD